jgi:hypothetical protein
MAEATGKNKKAPQKAALSWEELLVEKALARIHETNRQVNESAERFEREMMEKNRQIHESAGRFEQRMRESAEHAGREMRGSFDPADIEIKGGFEYAGQNTSKTGRLTDVNNPNIFSTGSAGHIDLPNLMQKFHEMGFVFERSYKDAVINDKKHHISFRIDITLEGSDKILIVEAKAKPTNKDITGHVERMKKVRQYGDLHGESRKYIGAISGINFNENEKLFAMKNGFYVIESSGNSFNITAPEGVYFPVEW